MRRFVDPDLFAAPAPSLGAPSSVAPSPAPSPKGGTVGDAAPYQPPLPSLTDMRLIDEIMARGDADPHVDIVVMYRRRCGHCKPEISRVYDYARSHPDVSAYAVEVDADPNIDTIKSLLLDDREATPSTGYFAHGKLQLSSPSRKESVAHWVDTARKAS